MNDNPFPYPLAIVTAYENSSQHDPSSNNAMLGVHASASAIIQYGKIARKQGLVNVALDILSRIHTIPTVPIVDCFQKIRQQVKCYLQLAGVMGKNECMQVGHDGMLSTCTLTDQRRMTVHVRALGQAIRKEGLNFTDTVLELGNNPSITRMTGKLLNYLNDIHDLHSTVCLLNVLKGRKIL